MSKQSPAKRSSSGNRPLAGNRVTRQQQYEQRRLERERAAQLAQRRKWTWRISFIAGGVAIVGLIVYLVVSNLIQANAGPALITGKGTYTTAADGSTRDGMSCLGSEGAVQHIHMYLAIYIDGKQYQVPGGTGIANDGTCFYPLHVHTDTGDENIIHEESPNNDTYTLGAFFDIWGQQLSRTSALGYAADATHKLTFVTFDGAGHKTVVTGNPLNIKFSEHETIYILYNSPNITPQPFTKFLPGE